MKIEILYPELTNAYGDSANIMFLKKLFNENEIVLTQINDEPYFVKNDVDFIYMGSHPDEYDDIIIRLLKPHIDRLKELIEKGKVVLFTGTALDICGSYIEENNNKKETLNLFSDLYVKRDKKSRFSSLFLGNFDDIEIVGNKSQFTFMYGENKYPFIKAIDKCIGMNKESKDEGIHYKNFFATNLLGPFLILNPYFVKYLLKLMNDNRSLVFEDQLIKTYENRLEILKQPNLVFVANEMNKI